MLNALAGTPVMVETQTVKVKPNAQLRAAVLLGINAALGSTDVVNLQPKALGRRLARFSACEKRCRLARTRAGRDAGGFASARR